METKKSWVSVWANAMSIAENRPEAYAKDITLRYEITSAFSGDKLRLTFDNYCGTEPIEITKSTVICRDTVYQVSFAGGRCAEVEAGARIQSDPIAIPISAGESFMVNFYLGEFTQMRSAVYVQGPRSGNSKYALHDQTEAVEFDIEISKKAGLVYFLSDVSIYTEENHHAIVCYGDSITAQDWPDYLAILMPENSVVRKATSGSRILREYSCITYNSYGLKATNRFPHEAHVDGADTIIIQQGINDIIHPVGTNVNPFRPMSDLPTAEDLIEGLKYYIENAYSYGYQRVYLGTLLPIEGWRTYADFRETLRQQVNDWMRTTDLVDGCIDFDRAVCDPDRPTAFLAEYDSGDHLHPSALGYKAMAQAAL